MPDFHFEMMAVAMRFISQTIIYSYLGGNFTMANKWVYMFSEGDMTMHNLLGGKGANLAEMTNIGLPVHRDLQ